MSETMYLHDVNLGDPMDAEGIAEALSGHGDSPAVRAILHLLRNSAAEGDRNARCETEHRDLFLGKATACEDTFWAIYRAVGGEGVAFERNAAAMGATGGNEVPDPDEAEHAAGGEE